MFKYHFGQYLHISLICSIQYARGDQPSHVEFPLASSFHKFQLTLHSDTYIAHSYE